MVYETESLSLRVEESDKRFDDKMRSTTKDIVSFLNRKYPKRSWNSETVRFHSHDWMSRIYYDAIKTYWIFSWNERIQVAWLDWTDYYGIRRVRVYEKKYLKVARFIAQLVEKLNAQADKDKDVVLEKHFR